MFSRERPNNPKRNARRVLAEVERLRTPAEGAVEAWVRCTIGMMKSKGGTGMNPCVFAFSDTALYIGKGGRWVNVLRVPLTYVDFVDTVPYLQHSFVLGIVGKEQVDGGDDGTFIVSSGDRGLTSFRDRPAYFFETLEPPVFEDSSDTRAFVAGLDARIRHANTHDEESTSHMGMPSLRTLPPVPAQGHTPDDMR